MILIVYLFMAILKGIYSLYIAILWFSMGFWAFLWAILVSLIRGEKGLSAIVMGYKIFARCWCFMSGIRIRMKGLKITNKTPPGIVVSNHGSILDMMTAPYVLPTKVSPLAKAEIKKIPMIGFMFKAVSVFVDRKDAESRKKSMEEMKRKLNNGVFIFMFPEGTRNRTQNPLKEFYDGAFKIAIAVQRPIMPLIFVNVRKLAPMGTILVQPGKIYGEFLEPIPTTGLTEEDVPMLKEKVYNIMYNYIIDNDPFFKSKK